MASGAQAQNPANDFTIHTQQDEEQQQSHHGHLDAGAGVPHLGGANALGSAQDYTSDNHLAGLVQAATAAAGRDVRWSQNEDNDTAAIMAAGGSRSIQNSLEGYAVGVQLNASGYSPAAGAQTANPFGGMPSATDPNIPNTIGRKRKRDDLNVDPAITSSGARMRYGDDNVNDATHAVNNGSSLDIREMPSQRAISNARAAGVHSAVALFRHPSETSKKYTRPPMSKMFSSLELTPENFLHLQAAAKAYMLDDNYPDRRECVGQRGRGDTEMVKLRLFNCARDFLDEEGNGVRFFGEHVMNDGLGIRTMMWPRDDHKIVSLVMPLLRRMVTNERQRQYAIESRKGGSVDGKKNKDDGEPVSKSTDLDASQRYHQPPPTDDTEIGMQNFIRTQYPSYQTDWDSVARSYHAFNRDYRLDNLGSISGLSQQDWWGVVASLDGHYQFDHGGNGALCDDPCIEYTVNHLVTSDDMASTNLRISDDGENIAARNYFATGITRDAIHLVRDYFLEHPFATQDPSLAMHSQASPYPLSADQQLPSTSQQEGDWPQLSESLTVTITANLISCKDQKRLLPPVSVPASQCSDFASLLASIRKHHSQQQQQVPQSQKFQLHSSFRIWAWLSRGLTAVENDAQLMAALAAADKVEWMDKSLVLVVDKVMGND